MSIEFHCEHCDRMIRANDEHGGKHGKCPSCHQQVYIPLADAEPLDLTPVDAAEERRAQQQAAESQRFADSVLLDGGSAGRGTSDSEVRRYGTGSSDAGRSGAGGAPPPAVDVAELINEFAIAMFDGELQEGEEIAKQLRPHRKAVVEVVDRIMADEIPPQALERIPRPVLMGFLKQLRSGA